MAALKQVVQQTTGYVVSEHIYVKADGKTVCGERDKDVAFMQYAPGERITPAQYAALIFPGGTGADPLPDAEQRSAEPADTEKRGGRRK